MKNLLDLALDEVRSRRVWPSSESVVIWRTQHALAFVKNEGGFLELYFQVMFQSVWGIPPKLRPTSRCSQGLIVGLFDPMAGDVGAWRESRAASGLYPEWVERCKELLNGKAVRS